MKRLTIELFVLLLVLVAFFAAGRYLIAGLGWNADGLPATLALCLGIGTIIGCYLSWFQRPFCQSVAQSQQRWATWIFAPGVVMFLMLSLLSVRTPLQSVLFALFALLNLVAGIQHWRRTKVA